MLYCHSSWQVSYAVLFTRTYIILQLNFCIYPLTSIPSFPQPLSFWQSSFLQLASMSLVFQIPYLSKIIQYFVFDLFHLVLCPQHPSTSQMTGFLSYYGQIIFCVCIIFKIHLSIGRLLLPCFDYYE